MQLESGESASPVITRLLGSYLAGEKASVFEFSAWERVGMRLLNALPPAFARTAVKLRFQLTALDPQDAQALTTQDLVGARLCDYAKIRGRKFPAIVIGAAMGGASAHLAAALGVPFLPQPFILGLRGGSPEDDLESHIELTSPVARQILKRNPELMAVAHFDPIHDGWLTRVVSHLRFKLITLPEGYHSFIKEVLEPGGAILHFDCRARWLQYELGERQRYQVGGWGGISAREFMEGSDRIDAALERANSPHRGGWHIRGLEPTSLPESEWGSEPGLEQALEGFAARQGFGFHTLTGTDPHAFSTLAYQAHKRLYANESRSPQGVVVETFTQYDPALTLHAGLLPLWLIFNTTDSLEFLKSQVSYFPGDLPVYFSGLVTLSRTPDMVPWGQWAHVFSDLEMRNVGARPQRYPEDLVSLWEWSQRLRSQLVPSEWKAEPGRLALDDLLRLAADLGMTS